MAANHFPWIMNRVAINLEMKKLATTEYKPRNKNTGKGFVLVCVLAKVNKLLHNWYLKPSLSSEYIYDNI